jgi:hypothetical protein
MQWILWSLLIIVVGLCAILSLALVHWGLQQLYLFYARRFCQKVGLTPLHSRSGPAFDVFGMKTEFTIVEVECRNADQSIKIIRLLVWIFGVRRVLKPEQPPPPPPVPPELLPRIIPYNPSIRLIAVCFGLAALICGASALFHLPRSVQFLVAVTSLGLATLICLRRFFWPRQIILSETTMTVPIGFLRLWPVCVNYSDITGVWVARLGFTGVLCVRASQRTVEIQDMFLPDQATFDLLRSHFDSLARVPS